MNSSTNLGEVLLNDFSSHSKPIVPLYTFSRGKACPLLGCTAFLTTEAVGLLSMALFNQQFLIGNDFAPQGNTWQHLEIFFVVMNVYVYVGAPGI